MQKRPEIKKVTKTARLPKDLVRRFLVVAAREKRDYTKMIEFIMEKTVNEAEQSK